MQRAQTANLFQTTCVDMIVDAVELLEQLSGVPFLFIPAVQ